MPEPSRTQPTASGVDQHMRRGYRICRWLAQAIYTFVWRGRAFHADRVPRTGGVLLVSNHQSFLDPVLATLAIPRECNYMARDTLFHSDKLRPVIEYLNAFAVKRGTGDVGAIKETIRRLKAGKVVLAFPEATRTSDGTIRDMRPGVVLIARKTKTPLVPTLILGAFNSWPRTQKLPKPRPIIVAYGQPLYPHKHPDMSDEACIAVVRNGILTLAEHYQRHPLLHGCAKAT